jgi:hypothetical protein
MQGVGPTATPVKMSPRTPQTVHRAELTMIADKCRPPDTICRQTAYIFRHGKRRRRQNARNQHVDAGGKMRLG